MNRRDSVLTLVALAAAPFASEAQPTAKHYRIGYLAGGGSPPDGALPALLRRSLSDLGFVEGKNVAYVGRWADARLERLPALAAELVGLNVDAILVRGGPAAKSAKSATTKIPIVLVGAGDAVAGGLITSLARPGGNVTGMSSDEGELSAKRMQILKEAVPKARRIAILWNSDDHAMTLRSREIDRAARVLNVTVQALGVREPDDFATAFAAMTRERPDALFLVADALTILNRKRVIEFAEARRIPAMYEGGAFVEGGGLIAYGPNGDDSLKMAARFLDRILKGAAPGDLPAEQPTQYYLTVNLKTAKALGLAIPQGLLVRADKLIE